MPSPLTLSPSFTRLLLALAVSATTSSLSAQDAQSLSTSPLIGVQHKDSTGQIINTSNGTPAIFSGSYVSIGIEKVTVNKSDSLIKQLFNGNRVAFPAANFRATYNALPLSISKMGGPVRIQGTKSSIDLGVQWGMVDRMPWIIDNANLDIRIGYTSDSTITELTKSFSSITSSIPDFTVSSSVAIGTAITKSIDDLVFKSERSYNLLRAERNFPMLAGKIREGYYAVFAASNRSLYEKYNQGNVIWTGTDLRYNGNPINDASYVVVSFKVTNQFYESVSDAVSDISKPWSAKYRDVLDDCFDLVVISTGQELEKKRESLISGLTEARTLLAADLDLLQSERTKIHQYVLGDALSKIEIAKNRIDANGKVTIASNEAAITRAVNTASEHVETSSILAAKESLDEAKTKPVTASADFGKQLTDTINSVEAAIK